MNNIKVFQTESLSAGNRVSQRIQTFLLGFMYLLELQFETTEELSDLLIIKRAVIIQGTLDFMQPITYRGYFGQALGSFWQKDLLTFIYQLFRFL